MNVYKPEQTYRASTLKVEHSKSTWQSALGKLPQVHALQSWVWGEFKSRWGWSMHPHLMSIAESSWEPVGASMILKRAIPRTPFCILYVPKGPLFNYSDAFLRQKMLGELERVAREQQAIFIKIDPDVIKSWGLEPERPSPVGKKFVQDLQDRGWRYSLEQIQFKNTVTLNLELSEDELMAAMKQKTRYNIRLAGRKGITIRHGTDADFEIIGKMYAQTAERDGFAIRPFAYYRDIWHQFYNEKIAHPIIAEYEGKPIAAVILVKFGDTTLYMYGASTNEERNRMPTYLLQWEAIRWAKAQGCKTYDFWGAPDTFDDSDRMWGVWRFKAGFNGEVVRHIGAWDYPVRPFLYWIYTVALPKYLAFLKR